LEPSCNKQQAKKRGEKKKVLGTKTMSGKRLKHEGEKSVALDAKEKQSTAPFKNRQKV